MFNNESESSSEEEPEEAKKPSKFVVMPMKDEVHKIIMSSIYQAKKQGSIKKVSK